MFHLASSILVPLVDEESYISPAEEFEGLAKEPERFCAMRCILKERINYLNIFPKFLLGVLNSGLPFFFDLLIRFISHWL